MRFCKHCPSAPGSPITAGRLGAISRSTVKELASFAETLPSRKAPVTESATIPLWHQPLVFLLALACFVAEWGLRRWKGMA